MESIIWQQVLPLLPPAAAPQPAKPARPDFGLDPLDFIELVLQVERQFGIRFSAAELTELRVAQRSLSSVERSLRPALYAEFFARLLQNGTWL